MTLDWIAKELNMGALGLLAHWLRQNQWPKYAIIPDPFTVKAESRMMRNLCSFGKMAIVSVGT
jgi:hypothetical protein